ncbi:hypothetical protein [Ottowia caeni]
MPRLHDHLIGVQWQAGHAQSESFNPGLLGDMIECYVRASHLS